MELLCKELQSAKVVSLDQKVNVGLHNNGMLAANHGKQCSLLDCENYFLKTVACGGKSIGGFYCNFFHVCDNVVARYINFGALKGFGATLGKFFKYNINWCSHLYRCRYTVS